MLSLCQTKTYKLAVLRPVNQYGYIRANTHTKKELNTTQNKPWSSSQPTERRQVAHHQYSLFLPYKIYKKSGIIGSKALERGARPVGRCPAESAQLEEFLRLWCLWRPHGGVVTWFWFVSTVFMEAT